MIGTYLAFEFNSLCFNFVSLLRFNFVRCIVKFVGLNRTAALFVGLIVKVCWLLFLLTYCCPLQFRCTVSVVVFIFATNFKLEFA